MHRIFAEIIGNTEISTNFVRELHGKNAEKVPYSRKY
jgi:hypothetical protein